VLTVFAIAKRSAIVKRTAKAAPIPLLAVAFGIALGWAWPVTLMTVVLALGLGWVMSKPAA
jgi:hypothetical protein